MGEGWIVLVILVIVPSVAIVATWIDERCLSPIPACRAWLRGHRWATIPVSRAYLVSGPDTYQWCCRPGCGQRRTVTNFGETEFAGWPEWRDDGGDDGPGPSPVLPRERQRLALPPTRPFAFPMAHWRGVGERRPAFRRTRT